MRLVDLGAASDPGLCGGKAPPLACLLNAGLPVPPGFVIPTTASREVATDGLLERARELLEGPHEQRAANLLPIELVDQIEHALERLAREAGTPYVAVRSSATSEDGEEFSAAGQFETVLGASGTEQVSRAVLACWASADGPRALAYRGIDGGSRPQMAVLVQALVSADVAGVMFTGATTMLEASWGLGESVVSGRVTPDRWRVTGGSVTAKELGRKATRTDLVGDGLTARAVEAGRAQEWSLEDDDVVELSRLGQRIGAALGRERLDVEWARSRGRSWVLQARPVTGRPPAVRRDADGAVERRREPDVLVGVAASPGSAAGPARIVRGPSDFASVLPGDILVCQHTDPAWTPLFMIASAVVAESGGVLSHPAIVAREVGIPAVVGAEGAIEAFEGADWVVVDGDRGTVRRTR